MKSKKGITYKWREIMKGKENNVRILICSLYSFLIYFFFISLSYSQSTSQNLMSCGIFNKNNVPQDYQPVASLMVDSGSIVENKVGNAHLANFSDSYDYNLYCSAGNYGDIEGIILEEGISCFSKKMMEVVNTSGKENAHVQSPECSEAGCSDKYDYQLCIYPTNYKSYSTILCQIEDNDCDEGETCLFKFAGERYTYTNAHVYDCEYPNLPSNTKAVCCTYTVSNLKIPIIRTHNPYKTGEEHKIFVPLGTTRYIYISLYNADDEQPHIIDLYILTGDSKEEKTFSNFLWFEDESKKYSADPRHLQVLLSPLEKRAITVNVFGGMVGEYEFYISQKNEAGNMERIATYDVYILPSQAKGVSGSAPEFPTWGYFLILLSSSLLLFLNLKKL